jgi:L-ascorbate metabolism protein UlaG (beta-lactamase superfamily)
MRFIRALMLLKRSSIEEMWTGMLPVAEPGQASTPYTAGPHGERPTMGLGFFVVEHGGHRYIYHDGDQGGFSSELLIDPADYMVLLPCLPTARIPACSLGTDALRRISLPL